MSMLIKIQTKQNKKPWLCLGSRKAGETCFHMNWDLLRRRPSCPWLSAYVSGPWMVWFSRLWYGCYYWPDNREAEADTVSDPEDWPLLTETSLSGNSGKLSWGCWIFLYVHGTFDCRHRTWWLCDLLTWAGRLVPLYLSGESGHGGVSRGRLAGRGLGLVCMPASWPVRRLPLRHVLALQLLRFPSSLSAPPPGPGVCRALGHRPWLPQVTFTTEIRGTCLSAWAAAQARSRSSPPQVHILFPNVCGVHSERPHHTWWQPPSQGSSFIPAAVWGQVLGDLRGCHLAVLLLSLHPNTQCSCYQKKGKLQIDSQSALVHPWWRRFSCLGRSARARSSRVVLGAESSANSGLSIRLWFPTGHGETESWHLEQHQQHVLAVLR